MKHSFYTVFASKRKKKRSSPDFAKSASACTHPGEREVRNKQKSFPLLTFQIFLFHSKPFGEETVSKSLRKCKNTRTIL